jgi:hypothetical protein
LAITGLLLGFLAGCGAGDDSADGSDDDSANPFDSPLGDLMGWQNESPEESRRKQLEVEDLVAVCMREQGWEYIPVDYAAQFPEQDEASEQWQDPEAFGEKHGYGVVFNYEQWEEASLLGEESPADMAMEDPNAEYTQGLSESENQEYYASLYGEPVEAPAMAEGDSAVDTGPIMIAPEDQGCYGQASAEVYGSDPMMENPDLQERMSEFYEDMQNDPRLVDANEKWLECINDEVDGIEVAGGPIERPEQMYSYVEKLKYEAMGLELVPYDESAQMDGNYYSAWSGEDGVGEAAVGEPEPISESDLEELRALEIDLWSKDWACQEEAEIRETSRRIEEDLVDELRAEFPELGSEES